MKFFNLDLHISVIEDLKCIFKDLGHQIDSVCISGHNFVFNRNPQQIETVTQQNWHMMDIRMCHNFYEKWKNILNQYDGFVVTYPPAFSLLYQYFDKPIIIQAPIRFDVPFTKNPVLLKWFIDFLKKGIKEKRIILAANSLYDKDYCEFYINEPCQYIPNLCEYGGRYPKYTGQQDYYLLSEQGGPLVNNPHIVNKNVLGRYSWNQLVDAKGIIHFPYNASTMSIFEQYGANVPLYFPSKDFLLKLYEQGTGVLNQLSWRTHYGLPPEPGDNPNNYADINVVKKWMDKADFYNIEEMPFIKYFNSIEELNHIVNTATNHKEISNSMKEHNIKRKINIYDKWDNILKGLNHV